MRKSELKVGEVYAVGEDPHGAYNRRSTVSLTRMRLVELNGTREVTTWRGKARKTGLVLKVMEGGVAVTAGQEVVLENAREVRMPWSMWVKLRDERRAREQEGEAERERQRQVWESCERHLRVLGIEASHHGGKVSMRVDTLAALLGRIPESS